MKSKIAKLTAQQGDVNFRRIEAMPDGEQVLIARERCVVAEGEHTGHSHVIKDSDAELVRVGEKMLLKLTKAATVKHQEHNPITLAPGIWEVGRVREFDWFSRMERQVID